MSMVLRFWPHVVIAVAAFATGVWISNTRCKVDLGKLDAEFLAYRLEHESQAKKAIREVLAKEQAQARKNQELSLANAAKDDAITKLAGDVRERVGALRLCQSEARDSVRMSAGTDRSSSGNPRTPTREELPTPDAGSFIELAADADRVMNQLETCQAWAQSLQ